jgi:hypothetical protein
MRVLGRVQTFVAEVSEPQPGRVLVERNGGPRPSVTTFTVDRIDANRARVTITTELSVRGGLLGKLERVFTRRYLEPIYMDELRRLDEVAKTSMPQRNA